MAYRRRTPSFTERVKKLPLKQIFAGVALGTVVIGADYMWNPDRYQPIIDAVTTEEYKERKAQERATAERNAIIDGWIQKSRDQHPYSNVRACAGVDFNDKHFHVESFNGGERLDIRLSDPVDTKLICVDLADEKSGISDKMIQKLDSALRNVLFMMENGYTITGDETIGFPKKVNDQRAALESYKGRDSAPTKEELREISELIRQASELFNSEEAKPYISNNRYFSSFESQATDATVDIMNLAEYESTAKKLYDLKKDGRLETITRLFAETRAVSEVNAGCDSSQQVYAIVEDFDPPKIDRFRCTFKR